VRIRPDPFGADDPASPGAPRRRVLGLSERRGALGGGDRDKSIVGAALDADPLTVAHRDTS